MPFETPCHHRLCLDCATRLPLSGAGSTRLCPMCREAVPVVKASPETQKELDDDAAAAFPAVWAFWGKLKAMSSNWRRYIFDLVAVYIRNADAEVRSTLVLLQLSKRLNSSHTLANLYLEPLLKTEAGQEWDGAIPWLDRVLTAYDTAQAAQAANVAYLATASEAQAAHAVAAGRVIKAVVAHAHSSTLSAVRGNLSTFVSRYIAQVEGGLAALADAPGSAYVVSVGSIRAELPNTAPSKIVSLIKLLCRVAAVNPLSKGDLVPCTVAVDTALARSPAASEAWAAMADGRFASVRSLCDELPAASPAAIVPLVKLICRITGVKAIEKDDLIPFTLCVASALSRTPDGNEGWAAIARGCFASVSSLCAELPTAAPDAVMSIVKLICCMADAKPLGKDLQTATCAALRAALAYPPAASGGWPALVNTPGVACFVPNDSLVVALLSTQPAALAVLPLVRLLCKVIESNPPGRDSLVLAASAVKAGVSRVDAGSIAERTAAGVAFAALVYKQCCSAEDANHLLDQQLPVIVLSASAGPAVAAAAAEAGKRKRS